MERFRKSILTLLGISFIFMLGITLFKAQWNMKRQLDKEGESYLFIAQQLLEAKLAEETQLIDNLLNSVEKDEHRQAAWLSQDRAELAKVSRLIFRSMHKKFKITHFYYHNTNKFNFLRVHDPDRYGDPVQRFTLQEAVQKNHQSAGVELGPLGTLTLRVVRPWKINNKLVGYLELGKEIDNILIEMKKVLRVNVFVLVKKDLLNRIMWEDGMLMLGRYARWSQFADFVNISDVDENIPKEVVQYFNHKNTDKNKQFLSDFKHDRHYIQWGGFPLFDVSGKKVGNLVVVRNITAAFNQFHSSTIWVLISITTILGIFLIICLFYGRLEQLLFKNRKALDSEITERKKSEIRYKAIFDNSHDLIQITDIDGRLIRVNQAWMRTLNYDVEEISRLSLRDLLSSNNQTHCELLFQKAVTEGSINNIQTTFVAKGGKKVVVEGYGYCHYEGGVPNYIECYFRDISQQKELEEQLIQSQKMEAVGALAGGIAHDFNNILTPILAYTELTMGSLPNESQERKNLSEVLKAGKKAKKLVQQILSFSKQSEQEQHPMQINPVIEEALMLMRSSMPSNIEIRRNIDETTGKVFSNANRIHQLIITLCSNAYEAMQENGGILTVVLKEFEVRSDSDVVHVKLTPGKYFKLEVSDNGCGMSQEVKEKIFDPYFTTKDKQKGSGLGLSVVHAIIKSMSGEILVYSEPGKGTKFHIYLPQVDAVSANEVSKPETIELLPHGTERIMLIDNEEMLIQLYRQLLENLGFDVLCVKNEIEAFDLFRKEADKFDLIIADVTIAQASIEEFTQTIHAIRQDMPIIVCVAFGEMIDKEKTKAAGNVEFLMKPILKTELVNGIKKLLEKH